MHHASVTYVGPSALDRAAVGAIFAAAGGGSATVQWREQWIGALPYDTLGVSLLMTLGDGTSISAGWALLGDWSFGLESSAAGYLIRARIEATSAGACERARRALDAAMASAGFR